jgi:glycolate oxidase iron-sulfur subunit
MINHIENPDSDNYSSVPWFNQDDLYTCVHCGFCLQACPTYLETGLESESPRGRISLMKGVNEGRIPINDTVLSHWDMCIQCRACESVCPSGVPYGNLIEDTMANVKKIRKNNIIKRFKQIGYQVSIFEIFNICYENLLLQWIEICSS